MVIVELNEIKGYVNIRIRNILKPNKAPDPDEIKAEILENL